MSRFENIAATDMKLRLVVAVGITVLIGVDLPALLILRSSLGFLIGGGASIVAMLITARWMLTE